jgi:hypothetical protein
MSIIPVSFFYFLLFFSSYFFPFSLFFFIPPLLLPLWLRSYPFVASPMSALRLSPASIAPAGLLCLQVHRAFRPPPPPPRRL